MDAGLLLQWGVVAVVVAASAAYVARRQFPAAVRALRVACAVLLLREGRPAWVRALGRRIAPAPRGGGDGGCGGCSSGCDTPRAP